MRARPDPVEALGTLLRVEDSAERRANWRQAIAALGHHAAHGLAGAPPLEGVDPDVVARAAQLAIESGLADDLAWLGEAPAAVALYEITAALPAGKTRRELGRRVFSRLYEGTATTFAAVATRMALTSSRPFETATLRARVGLLFDMPIGCSVNADPLALTLVTRRELRERWIDSTSTGTLPSRRLAAKLIEHAAREAALRAHQGDLHPAELMTSEPIRGAYLALLADREPLVWRHAAVARGLLAGVVPALAEEIELALDPALTPTEWRRAGVSLVASLVSDPEQGLRAVRQLIEGPLLELDKGLLATLTLGLPRVIEAEPEAAEQVLLWLGSTRRPDVADAMAALLADVQHASFGAQAVEGLRETLRARAELGSSALRAVADRLLRQLDRAAEDPDDVVGLVRSALFAYETRGARAAFEIAGRAAQALTRAMDFMAINDPRDEQLLPYVLGTLSDIDSTALERSRLTDLLLLGRRPGDTDVSVPEMAQLYDRLGHWLLNAEAVTQGESSAAQTFAEQRRLRALLHLMDVDCTRQEEDRRVRTRICHTIQLLLQRIVLGQGSVSQRIACAALARAFDAAVREGVAEPADLLLALAACVPDANTYRSVGEASTNPDVRGVVRAYAEFLNRSLRESQEPSDALSFEVGANVAAFEPELRVAERVMRLSRGLGAGGSYRGEALRRIVLRLGRGLEAVAQARGQMELVDSGSGHDALGDLEAAVQDLQRLTRGAQRRLGIPQAPDIAKLAEVASVSSLIERAIASELPASPEELGMAVRELSASLAAPLGNALSVVLSSLENLPVAAESDVFPIPLERRRAQLPDWLLPRRTIGAFYVVRSLGRGGVSSVFLARRSEERGNPRAEGFALKVPDYDPTTARSLSEEAFLQLFREEAGALLSLPAQQNLARFVTFDAGARPKPILVMELIRGASLDRLIRNRSLSVPDVIGHLEGIAAGLETMHAVGIAHLDVKPSNVILRYGREAVLVDFGLSGRHLRPGCGTIDYSAPEVLGVGTEHALNAPLPADVYAFGCMMFEALTGELLFDGDDEQTIGDQHLAHDGWPAHLTPLAHDPHCAPLAKVIAACLRRDPRNRPSIPQLRAALVRLRPLCVQLAWPLSAKKPRRRAAS